MDVDEYFRGLSESFSKAYVIADEARKKGYDPERHVEIMPAKDLAGRVEGITGIAGAAELVKRHFNKSARNKMMFEVVQDICTSEEFAKYPDVKRIELSVRLGLAILTEGVQVAPTEGFQRADIFRNYDNSNYVALFYAGPIRGAGGTTAAMSVMIADYARKFFGVGEYKALPEDIERYVEEIETYHVRAARLQYKPSDDDIRTIIKNCPVCVEGLPTEDIEVSRHRDLKKISEDGKEVKVTNRVRGGIALVVCEGIAQKAKKLIKAAKEIGLDWNWLNDVIKVGKQDKEQDSSSIKISFLDELVAGRPILAYPDMFGGFRLRYGRSRMTGIAAKGVNPATMIILDSFIAVGTQLKMETAGKGCVACPVDSIEGPFVVLDSGEALRINSAEKAKALLPRIKKIICIGDMLITYGDFKKSNSALIPSSYTEELWDAQLRAGSGADAASVEVLSFKDAYTISLRQNVPLHPKFLFEFQNINKQQLAAVAGAVAGSIKDKSLFDVGELELDSSPGLKETLELMTVTHSMEGGKIIIGKEYAQSIIASLGFASGEAGIIETGHILEKIENAEGSALDIVNSIAPFRLMKRSSFIGARIGRPEKAKERLMKPAPNVLFPIGEYGGKERNITKAYMIESKKFGNSSVSVEMPRYMCGNCKRILDTGFCYDCQMGAILIGKCIGCGTITNERTCHKCGNKVVTYETRSINIVKAMNNASKKLGIGKLPASIKGVKGISNKGKMAEALEKGILRSMHGIHIFKDTTARFDSTDVPITHFYPDEIGLSVEKARDMGYVTDYTGRDLTDGSQLVEMRHQDIIISKNGGDFMLKIANFVDDMLDKLYGLPRYYNAKTPDDLIGHLFITLAPHTSCGILCRLIGYTEANVGFSHPYTVCARRRNCDGDEDTVMLLLDALINFSKSYMPGNIGGSMDAPLVLTVNVYPDEVDDEVHDMEIVERYDLGFYEKTFAKAMPGEVEIEKVANRLGKDEAFSNIMFTHDASIHAVRDSPKRSVYTQLKTMQEKVDAEFRLMDKINAVNKAESARKLIVSHFIPDLIGNLNSFSKQMFRCSGCNAKYRRVPLTGKCTRCGGKLLLTISKGGIEKYLDMAINLSDRYNLDHYISQRLQLVKQSINAIFGEGNDAKSGQFNLGRFI